MTMQKHIEVARSAPLFAQLVIVAVLLFSVAITINAQAKSSAATPTPNPSPPANALAPTPAPGANPNAASTPAPSSSPAATAPAPAAAKGSVVLPAEKSKPVTMVRFDKPPVIDGKLDEEVWKKAAVLKDFYQIQPGDNTAPSKPTEVLLGYDPKFLYIAFQSHRRARQGARRP